MDFRERPAVTRNESGDDPKDVVGYVVQGNDATWRIEGRHDEVFNSALSAANAIKADA